MNKKQTRKTAALLAGLLAAPAAFAAQKTAPKVTITDISVEDNIYTPFYEARTVLDHQQGSSQKWLQLHVEYTTEGGWIDELTIDQSALVREEGMPPVVVDEEVSYINIKPGDHYANVYMHPHLVERYGVDSYEVDTAAVIRINGKEVARAETTKQAKKGWEADIDAIPHKGHLLSHDETPFWFINYDFKEIIKKDQHRHGREK